LAGWVREGCSMWATRSVASCLRGGSAPTSVYIRTRKLADSVCNESESLPKG